MGQGDREINVRVTGRFRIVGQDDRRQIIVGLEDLG